MLSKVTSFSLLFTFSASTSGDKAFFAPTPAGSQMYFFDSLSYPLRAQQISPLQNQYMGRFFTPQSGSPSPGEINKMKGISLHTAVRLHNPYFPQGHAAAIDQTCCKALWGVVNESGLLCGEGTVCVVLGSQHLEPETVNKPVTESVSHSTDDAAPPMGEVMSLCFLLELKHSLNTARQ